MPLAVCTGAMMACPFGAAPATLVANAQMQAATATTLATVMDHKPMANIPAFGTCMSLANPTVAAATAAALGVLTPMPCVPNTVAPWAPGSPTVTIGGFPALNSACMCNCMWGGVITITNPGQTTIMVP